MSPEHELLGDRESDLFAPLCCFYGAAGLLALEPDILDARELPQPARRLLWHDTDMTSTLEGFFGDRIYLDVLRQEQQEAILTRQVTLRLNSSDRGVEFGAIRIDLSRLAARQKQLIREGRQPLGAILNDFDIPYESHASQFFRVKADPVMIKCLALEGPQGLYGRCNTLTYKDGTTLADVVEVLPPLCFLKRSGTEGTIPGARSGRG